MTGDQTGITSTLNLCTPEQHLQRHFLLPMHMPASLSDEDRRYLDSKGVFTLPGKEACYSLIRAYFRHVHPIMPIIEADRLLYAFRAGRLQDYNVLLVWSVFFVAVNVFSLTWFDLDGKLKRAVYPDIHMRERRLRVPQSNESRHVLPRKSAIQPQRRKRQNHPPAILPPPRLLALRNRPTRPTLVLDRHLRQHLPNPRPTPKPRQHIINPRPQLLHHRPTAASLASTMVDLLLPRPLDESYPGTADADRSE